MQPSPYTPGEIAPEVFGREQILEDIRRDLAFIIVEPRFVGRIQVFAGPRGVGKTSLLRAAQTDAAAKGFDTVWVTAGDGPLLASLVEALEEVSGTWQGSLVDALRSLISTAKVEVAGISVSGAAPRKGTEAGSQGRRLQRLLAAAGRAARERSRGLVLFIDEIQSADADGIKALAYAWQHMQSEQRDLPMAAYTAGLSHTQDVVTDAVSFAERFAYQHLHNLTRPQAADALRSLAAAKGVRWSDDALEAALGFAGGYPYFMQVIGDETWRAAGFPGPGTVLEVPQVEAAGEGFNQMRQTFFRARWKKATPAEARMLRAMAAAGEPEGDAPVKRSAIAEAMGRDSNDLSMARRSLLDKGLIDTSSHGYLEFTAPGFAEFVRGL